MSTRTEIPNLKMNMSRRPARTALLLPATVACAYVADFLDKSGILPIQYRVQEGRLMFDGGGGRPFLRWAGSKRKLLPKLLPYWGQGFGRYIEPFAGSAALFFAIQPPSAILSDINRELIDTLCSVRDHSDEVHDVVSSYALGKRSFYRLRAIEIACLSPIQRAARFLFLNRFCFNGLYRTNGQGRFNVPFAASGTGALPTREQLKCAASVLQRAHLVCADFETVLLENVRAGDFVYLDPPYAVANRRVFRQYGPDTFGLEDMARLKTILEAIQDRGAYFVLSYADCHEARMILEGWSSRRVFTHRNISGFARHRRRAAELIITNTGIS